MTAPVFRVVLGKDARAYGYAGADTSYVIVDTVCGEWVSAYYGRASAEAQAIELNQTAKQRLRVVGGTGFSWEDCAKYRLRNSYRKKDLSFRKVSR